MTMASAPPRAPLERDTRQQQLMLQSFRRMQHLQHLSQDRTVALVFASILLAVACYNLTLMARIAAGGGSGLQPGSAAQETKQLLPTGLALILHMLLEFHGYAIQTSQFYKRHRIVCLVALRGTCLLLMMLYVPRTWQFSVPHDLAAGRSVALTYRLIIAGVSTASSILEILAYPLPLAVAAPYHSCRAALSLASLPAVLDVFRRNAELRAVAGQLWRRLSTMFGGAAVLILGLDIPGALDAACPCPTSALLLFTHLALGLFLPLHILGLREARSWKAFALQWQQQHTTAPPTEPAAAAGEAAGSEEASSSGSSPGSSSSSGSSSLLAAPAAALRPDPGAAGSSSSRSGGSVCPDAPMVLLPASSEEPGSLPELEWGPGLHSVFMFCVLMLLWALLDAFVTVAHQRIGGLCV